MNSVLNGFQIVLVDDDPSQARLYAAALGRKLGDDTRLHLFVDSASAGAYLDSHLVDILITDLRMPQVDGLELVRRAKKRCPGVQVLIMTAASTADSLLDAADLGATDYLLKPFANETLIALVVESQQRLIRWRTALSGTLHHDFSPAHSV